MSVRHPEFVDLVDRIAGGEAMTEDDHALLAEYAEGRSEIEDQLDGSTVEAVREFTGREDVWSPQRAARALLGVQHAA